MPSRFVGVMLDAWWSTSYQPGSPYGNRNETAPRLESVVAVLSTGPVTPGDGISFANVTLLNYCIRQDGLILKPDRPAFPLEATYRHRSFGSAGPSGEVYHTFTHLNGFTWHIVMAAETDSPYRLTSTELGITTETATSYTVWQYFNARFQLDLTTQLIIFNSSQPLILPVAVKENHYVGYISPIFPLNGMSILGELNKWVPVSSQRIVYVQVRAGGITVGLQGGADETVVMAYSYGPNNSVGIANCVLGDEGRVYLVLSRGGSYSCTVDRAAADSGAGREKGDKRAAFA